MTPEEIDAYYRQIVTYIRQGKTDGWIQRHYGLNRQTARRHISRARGMMENESPRPIASSRAVVAQDIPYPIVAGRQIALVSEERPNFRPGRQTAVSGGYRLGQVIQPPESGDWRLENISPDELRAMAPADLITRMIRVSPEIARAYFDFLRMANPGHDLKAVIPGTDTPHDQGQLALDFFERQLAQRNNRGSADVVY